MKILLNSLKSTFPTIFHVSGYFRPIPATYCINKNPKNHEKLPKKCEFLKIDIRFCSIVAKNMIFRRKLAVWAPKSTQKPYIDPPT